MTSASTGRALDIGVVGKNILRNDGQGRVMLEMVTGLVERGHRVTVYAQGIDPDLKNAVSFRRLPRLPGPDAIDDVAVLLWMTLTVRRARHDVSVLLGPTALPRPPFAISVQFSHRGWERTWSKTARPPRRHRMHAAVAQRLELLVTRRASVVIATTDAIARDILEGDGVEGPPVVVVPPGIDPGEYPPITPVERVAARARFGLADGQRTVAFVGGYGTGRKGLLPLLDAIALGPEHLLVAGSGDPRLVSQRVDELGITERVQLLGFVPAPEVLAAADIVAVPSLYEPFSLVGVEAACRGLPVAIAASAGATPHIRDAAVVIPDASDPEQIRAALDRLADPEERTRLGARGPAAAAALAWDVGPAVRAIEGIAAGWRSRDDD